MALNQPHVARTSPATLSSYLWRLNDEETEGYLPVSGTPPSPSARQARLISPSHSLPEFLPVLHEASTLKAPLLRPTHPPISLPANNHRRPSLNSRPSQRDLRRLSSFPSTPASLLSARLPSGLNPTIFPQSIPNSEPSSSGQKNLTAWVPHLMIFSLCCMVLTAATVALSIGYVERQSQADTGTFFHITDIHWDPLYRYHATSSSFCRTEVPPAPDKPFGQYGCDSPLLLLKTALMEMSEASARPDFVLVTGDSAAHNLPADVILRALSEVDAAIGHTFDAHVTKRLHAIGVQELSVLDSKGWNFTQGLAALAQIWNVSLVEASDDAYDTFLKGGYYMAIFPSQARQGPAVQDAGPDLSSQTSNVAALVLNTVLYRPQSSALRSQMGTPGDPAGQLAWLREQLHQARHWGRKVLIAGHVPPGVDTRGGEAMWESQFEQQFTSIVLEHSDVVVGLLFGYMHRDHFTLMHADSPADFQHDLRSSKRASGLLERGGKQRQNLVTRGETPGKQKKSNRYFFDILPGSQLAGLLPWLAQSRPGRRSANGESGPGSAPRGSAIWPEDWHPAVIGGSSAAVFVAPSVSPVLLNRPAFRLFSYDRAGLLLDYQQHTADLLLQGAEQMWQIQYGARSAFGLGALDGSNFEELSSSFFNASGYPTERFAAFCELMSACNNAGSSGTQDYDCCSDCPDFMRCAVESGTFKQFLGCSNSSFAEMRTLVPGQTQAQ